jgi:hypothetical protein
MATSDGRVTKDPLDSRRFLEAFDGTRKGYPVSEFLSKLQRITSSRNMSPEDACLLLRMSVSGKAHELLHGQPEVEDRQAELDALQLMLKMRLGLTCYQAVDQMFTCNFRSDQFDDISSFASQVRLQMW